MDELIRQDFQPYLTSVGGSGLGILSPYPEHRNRGSVLRIERQDGQVTPPETPHSELAEGYETEASALASLRPVFETAVKTDLPEWTTSLGRWLYV